MNPRRTIAAYLGLAVLCIAAARPIEAQLVRMRRESGMEAYSGGSSRAGAALVRSLGGLRGIVADLAWMRALGMQEAGRHYETVVLLDGLLEMQPHFTSVWAFQASVLAFDLGSVEANADADAAYGWVRRGIGVLERGIERNPASAMLEERLAMLYLVKLSPASSDPSWKTLAGKLNDDLAGRSRLQGREQTELVERIREHLADLAAQEGRPVPAPDDYTALRLARWHFLRAASKRDITPGRKLLCERLAVRCLERMGDWAAAERSWLALYQGQGRKDPQGFFREFMVTVVCEQLLMGHGRESREAFARMRRYFPDGPGSYREFLAGEIRGDRARGREDRARLLYRALCAVEPGETRSYEEIAGGAAPR